MSQTSYTTTAKVLHWLMSVMMIGLVAIGIYMSGMEPADFKWTLYGLHKSTGFLVLMLVFIRLTWRLLNPPPEMDPSYPPFVKWAATWNIRLLYVLMFVYPASGLVMSYFGGHDIEFYEIFTIAGASVENKQLSSLAHFMHTEVLTLLLYAAFGAHTLGALYHHFIRKDDTLKKMV